MFNELLRYLMTSIVGENFGFGRSTSETWFIRIETVEITVYSSMKNTNQTNLNVPSRKKNEDSTHIDLILY
jgi:hypothetical protein